MGMSQNIHIYSSKIIIVVPCCSLNMVPTMSLASNCGQTWYMGYAAMLIAISESWYSKYQHHYLNWNISPFPQFLWPFSNPTRFCNTFRTGNLCTFGAPRFRPHLLSSSNPWRKATCWSEHPGRPLCTCTSSYHGSASCRAGKKKKLS